MSPPKRRTGVARRGQAPPERRKFEKSGRDDRGQQVEGRRAVRELLVAGRRKVHELLLSAGTEAPELAELESLAQDSGVRIKHVPADQIERRARTERAAGRDRVRGAGPGRRPRRPPRRSARVPRRARRRHRSAEPRRGDAQRRDRRRNRHRAGHATAPPGSRPQWRRRRPARVEYLPVAFVSGIPGALDRAKRAGVWCVGLDADGDQSVFDLVGRRRTARARARRRRTRPLAPRARALRRDRVDPDARSHRVAQRERGGRGRVHRDRAPSRGIAFRTRRVSSVGRALLL